MPTISLCMIVKNEEQTLPRCLESVGEVADEIIIVDTGSTDATKKVARRFTKKVYDFKWVDDFSAARNFSYSKATKDYILWLDADDIIPPESKARLLELKQTLDPSVDGVMMKYNTGFDANGNVTFSYYRERLSKRTSGFVWREPVHEYLESHGKIITVDIAVHHAKPPGAATPGRNLAIYERRVAAGEKLTPRGIYYFARELMDNGRWQDAIERFTEFLEDGRGWVEDNINACCNLARCHLALGQTKPAVMALVQSFAYDTPRGEACCQLGYLYKNLGDWPKAAFWFELATKLKKPEHSWGFINHSNYGYIPCIELAVCYDRLGDIDKAEYYNNLAGQYRPDSQAYLYNKDYFEKLRRSRETGTAPQ